MSKFLKRYNETTHKWELVSAPDVSVEQKLEDGSDITDTNVVITNEIYAKEERTTLDEALTNISDDISRLQRNVSWLAEHGGGGSGGGGGDQKSFGIEIISPTITDNAAYVTGKTFEIEFMITGGSEGDECSYAYVYDSNPQTDYAKASVNTSIRIPIDNTESALKEHSIIIRAINPYGTNITPKSFRIYESTLSLAFDVNAAGDDYKNGVYNIRQNSTYAYIPLLITNGLMNSRTVVTAKYNENQKNIEFTNETTSPQSVLVSLWDISKTVFIPGQYYVLTFNASATLGINTISSNEVQLRIRIVSPSEMTVVLGVNGTSGEEVDIPLNGSVVYNFKVYVPVLNPPVESTFYSAKIVNGQNSYLILGQYYDENTKAEGATSYSDNNTVAVGTTISAQYVLQQGLFSVNDNIQLYVKVWNLTGDRTAEASADIKVTEESTDVFPRQSNLRGTVGSTGNTVFLSWNQKNASSVHPLKWTSTVNDYAFIDYDLSLSGNTVISDINILDANDASGIKTDSYGTPFFRLQNRAYAVADLSAYENEVKKMTGENSENYGFTISYTIMQDAYNDTKHTLLLWGKNSASDGTLTDGIRVDCDKAYWAVNERTAAGSIKQTLLSCPITSGIKTTIDFSYVRTPNGTTARIYVNGILNSAADINILSPQYTFPNEIYFGTNNKAGTFERFADLNIYEFSVYTKSLNDLQIIVNGENARYSTIEEYNAWKSKNFITAKESDKKVPESVFFGNGNYITNFDAQQINNIAARSNIPTMYLNFGDSAEFTESYFYAKHVTTDTGRTFAGSATYYDPSTEGTADNISILVSLQGTSTLGYKIKNLEFYIDESFVKDGQTYPKLFQPKKNWFPESQFTLKADVVDSAHANNAVLGEWINNSGVFDNNPAMNEFGVNRPFDMDDSGNTSYGVDNDVTIKHTLEGFPILLFIKFSGNNSYTFLGIYSFNLGRYSYYNMGMKFLRGFSRRNGVGPGSTKVSCPKIINYYEEMDNLGSVNSNNVYSFELGNAGNGKIAAYPVWSQYRPSVIKTYGDFKYPNAVTDEIWNKLCALFESIAKFRITSYNGDLYNNYDDIKLYEIVDGQYVTDGSIIPQQNESSAQIDSREGGYLNIKNAVGYFIIANAFGMTDSLGKNMTLRTWDGGNTWYTCFYDMDTALGLANDGSESNPVTVCIDRVYMVSDPQTSISTLYTSYHDEDSKYAAVLSKIWGVFRDDRFLYLNRNESERYEYIWGDLRKIGGKLSKSSNFTDIMEARVTSCGEMIYNYDYNTKYIQDTAEQVGGSPAITFLHGTRVEYVKDWLRKHFYFLDGIFDVKRLDSSIVFTFDDSPYNSDILTLAVNYSSSIPVLPYTVQVSTPSFIGLSIGNDEFKKYYIETENTDTVIYLVNGTSANSQLSIKGSTLVTKFDGLQSGFLAIGQNPNGGEAKSLSIFNVSNSNALNENPVNIDKTSGGIFGKESSLERIDLSNTHGPATLQEYGVYLELCNKLINIDISNSDVTSLSLPNTSLQTLNIFNSNIKSFTLKNQNKLTDINFDGCNKIQTIEFDTCPGFSGITISDKLNLESVTISNCQNLTSVTINNCEALTSIRILNNINLKEVIISGCVNTNLDIMVYGSALSKIVISGTRTSKPITLPAREQLSGVTRINLDDSLFFGGFKYGSEEIETYGDNDDFVFDIRPFTSLNGNDLTAKNVLTIHYVRVENDINNPFEFIRKTFVGSSSVLTRIFGHILITESDAFKEFSSFYIREKVTDSQRKTPFDASYYGWDSGEYATNITFDNEILNKCFLETNCTLSDVYYVFHHIPTATSVASMFDGCKRIKTNFDDPLSEDLFTNTPLIENIDGLFGNGNIGGLINNALLDPIKSNLEHFDNVFGPNVDNETKYYTLDNTCFFPQGNIIKTITGFNPIPYHQGGGEPYPMQDDEMLKTLTELEEISNSFNDSMIDFTASNNDTCELFKTTTKLKVIENSFLRIHGWGSLKNIFGGSSSSQNEYPSQLESVTYSFSFLDSCDHAAVQSPIVDDDYRGVLMPIGNSFFAKIKNTIKNIGGNTIYSFYENSFFSVGSRGIKKYIDLDDCNGENFCYEIFDGCTNLEEIPYFFDGLEFNVTGKTFDTINLLFNRNGKSIFNGLTKLKNINYLFNGLKNVRYTLEGNAFKDCVIEKAKFLFAESIESYSAKKIGMIPFKLFYEEQTATTTSNVFGISEKSATELGIYDGYTGAIANDKFKFSFTYKKPRKTIKDLSNVFEFSDSTAITCYSASATTFDDWIEDNENYNPVKFYMSINGDTATYTLNNAYNPYKKKWNKYVYDGSVTEFNSLVVNSAEYQKVVRVFNGETIPEVMDDYGNPIIDMTLPAEFLPNYNPASGEYGTIGKRDTGFDTTQYDNLYRDGTGLFTIRNYFCPPDIFRYCENSRDTLVSAGFKDCSPVITSSGCGVKGTICPYLFEPISNISTLLTLFRGCNGILPYKWAKYNQNTTPWTIIETGYTYPPTLLSGLTELYTFSQMFSNNIMWGSTIVPGQFFATNTYLSDISSTWASEIWVEEELNQFPSELFANNKWLTNVASLFAYFGPKVMSSSLFTYANNPRINNCSFFVYRGSSVSPYSSVPTFWTTWNITNYKNAFVGISQDIINRQEIPEDWYTELS